MGKRTMLEQALLGARQRQGQHEAGTAAWQLWANHVASLQDQLLTLAVGYAGGCPNSIIQRCAVCDEPMPDFRPNEYRRPGDPLVCSDDCRNLRKASTP